MISRFEFIVIDTNDIISELGFGDNSDIITIRATLTGLDILVDACTVIYSIYARVCQICLDSFVITIF
jgi:hypothetical protein